MLVVGAKGFAKEVLEILHRNNQLENLVFYDDLTEDIGELLYSKFPILKKLEDAKEHFEKSNKHFTIGLGGPKLRKVVFEKFELIGGELKSTISSTSIIGNYNCIIEEGCNIMQGVVITNDVIIKKGTIINQLSSIGHDVTIGEFCEICPNVSISGHCTIGSGSFIGTGAIILPKVNVGKNVIVGAGAVVAKDLPDDCVAVGVPAKIVKYN